MLQPVCLDRFHALYIFQRGINHCHLCIFLLLSQLNHALLKLLVEDIAGDDPRKQKKRHTPVHTKQHQSKYNRHDHAGNETGNNLHDIHFHETQISCKQRCKLADLVFCKVVERKLFDFRRNRKTFIPHHGIRYRTLFCNRKVIKNKMQDSIDQKHKAILHQFFLCKRAAQNIFYRKEQHEIYRALTN